MDWEALLRANDGVARGSDLRAAGLSRHTLRTRLGNGTWQRVLPDVVVAHSGRLSIWECRRAAFLYAGPRSMLSHDSAAAVCGLNPTEHLVHVTVRNGRRLLDREFVWVHQSSRPCIAVLRGGLPCTPIPRTVVDIACTMRHRDDVSALVSRAVQRRMVTVAQLVAEAATLPRSRPAMLRQVLDDVAAGTRSAGEAAFLRLVRTARLPLPELNVPIRTPAKTYIVDALWRAERLIVEIDGAAWHLNAVSWQDDLRRQNRLHNAGYRVLRFPVQRLRDDPLGVIDEIRIALNRAA